jgi:ferritin
MMISKKMLAALNDQIHHELESAYIYLSMSAYFEAENLPGFAQWMKTQFDEEMIHAFKFYNFILARKERVVLQAISAPQAKYESPLDAFEQSLAHEQKITGDIHKLYKLANEENDYASISMLQWFVDEQVEEEENVGAVVEDLKRIQGSDQGLLMLDRELGKRQPASEEDAAA